MYEAITYPKADQLFVTLLLVLIVVIVESFTLSIIENAATKGTAIKLDPMLCRGLLLPLL